MAAAAAAAAAPPRARDFPLGVYDAHYWLKPHFSFADVPHRKWSSLHVAVLAQEAIGKYCPEERRASLLDYAMARLRDNINTGTSRVSQMSDHMSNYYRATSAAFDLAKFCDLLNMVAVDEALSHFRGNTDESGLDLRDLTPFSPRVTEDGKEVDPTVLARVQLPLDLLEDTVSSLRFTIDTSHPALQGRQTSLLPFGWNQLAPADREPFYIVTPIAIFDGIHSYSRVYKATIRLGLEIYLRPLRLRHEMADLLRGRMLQAGLQRRYAQEDERRRAALRNQQPLPVAQLQLPDEIFYQITSSLTRLSLDDDDVALALHCLNKPLGPVTAARVARVQARRAEREDRRNE